jgi:hypothetical protein
MTVALILSQPACHIYPIEVVRPDRTNDSNSNDYYDTDTRDDRRCATLPDDGRVTSCSDYFEASYGHPEEYVGTCCELRFLYSDACYYGHYETWCQWEDASVCGWEQQGWLECE